MMKLLRALILAGSLTCLHGQEFVVWHTETDPNTLRALDNIARRFEKDHVGVSVRMMAVGWIDLYRKITLAVQTGELPALAQIEPFMAAYLRRQRLLQPIDDVIEGIGESDIYPSVIDLQEFDGHRYGIATALGISYYSYRKDLFQKAGIQSIPRSWDDYLAVLRKLSSEDRERAPLLLPANDLHMLLLFSELLASNDGSLFDNQGRPQFMDRKVLETLRFWEELAKLVPPQYRDSAYSDNFVHYAQDRALTLPVFFGRGTLQIERTAPEALRSPEIFALFPHIVGPSGKKAYATLDAEPWVIFQKSPQPAIAREFLKFFYRKDNYLEFCRSVPIHLTPIFRSLATGTDYTSDPMVQKWRPFFDYQIKMLQDDSVLPIFMARKQDRYLTSLFRLEDSHVVSDMLRAITVSGRTPEEATSLGLKAADQLNERPLPESRGPMSWIIGALFAAAVAAILLLARRILRTAK